MAYEKIYVAMFLYVSIDGKMKPVEIEWGNGRRLLITKILDVQQAPPRHVGSSITVRYNVIIEGKPRELYFEKFENKWFVEKLVPVE